MRPSSQEAYASSGPRSPATDTSASATHTALGGFGSPVFRCAGWVSHADVCLAGDLGPEDAYAS